MRQEERLDRRSFLGGSDIAAVAGLDPYRTPLSVYNQKMGIAEEKEVTYRMMRGIYFEDGIAQAYARLHGKHLGPARVTPHHPLHPFIAGHLDRTLRDGPGSKASDVAVVECKTAGLRQSHKWGKPGERKIPLNYLAQAVLYAGLMALPRFVIVADLAWMDDLYVEEWEFDSDFYEHLIEIAARFWVDHVDAGVPPDPELGKSTHDDLVRLFPESTGEIVESTPELEAMDREAFALVKEKRRVETRLDEIKMAFQFHAGDASVVQCQEAPWKIIDRKGSVSWKDTAADLAAKAGIEIGSEDWEAICAAHMGKPTRFVKVPYSGGED